MVKVLGHDELRPVTRLVTPKLQKARYDPGLIQHDNTRVFDLELGGVSLTNASSNAVNVVEFNKASSRSNNRASFASF